MTKTELLRQRLQTGDVVRVNHRATKGYLHGTWT